MADERKEERGFVVIDRRGRAEEAPKEAPPSEREAPRRDAPSRPGGGPAPAPEAGPRPELPRIDFATFVLSLSTSALYHLGLVPDPETNQPGAVNKALARQTIDTLELLQEKTRGNLDPEEERLLQSLLYELRMRFVESR